MNDLKRLKFFSTKELVQELVFREGVTAITVEPYQDMALSINGPAIVLKIID